MSDFDKDWWETFRSLEIQHILELTAGKTVTTLVVTLATTPSLTSMPARISEYNHLRASAFVCRINSRELRLSVLMAPSRLTPMGIKPKIFFGISLVTR